MQTAKTTSLEAMSPFGTCGTLYAAFSAWTAGTAAARARVMVVLWLMEQGRRIRWAEARAHRPRSITGGRAMGVGADRPVSPETASPETTRGVSRVAMSHRPRAGAVANWIREIQVFVMSD